MEIYVFSYNRGKYLRNCLESLGRHAADMSVTVVDDGSRDPDTRSVLDEFSSQVRVIVNEGGSGSSLGGLYRNMNWAISSAREHWVLFIQDDMQLVRDVTEEDFAHIDRFFRAYPDSIEFQTCFIKGTTKIFVGDGIELDRDVPAYLREPERSNRAWFSAVGVFHAGRMKERGIELRDSESSNQAHVAQFADRMGLSPYPFMMWLPFAESVKFRRKGLLQRYAEWRAGAGLYPFRAMSEEEVQRLFARDLSTLPIADKILEPIGRKRDDSEWMYAIVRHYRLPRKMLKLQKRLRGETRRKSKGGDVT
jgi:glycosyltransferase involved in cell wall biosynthesis